MAGMLNIGMELVKKAFFTVVGYFLADVIVSWMGTFVPQVSQYSNIAIIGLGIFAGLHTSGMLQEMSVGAALYGATKTVEGVVNPVLAKGVNTLKETV